MGRVVPFLRFGTQAESPEIDDDQTNRLAEELIIEAASLLAGSGTDKNLPWLLEDCIDLLRSQRDTFVSSSVDKEDFIVDSKSKQRSSAEITVKDPRCMLKNGDGPDLFIRKK